MILINATLAALSWTSELLADNPSAINQEIHEAWCSAARGEISHLAAKVRAGKLADEWLRSLGSAP